LIAESGKKLPVTVVLLKKEGNLARRRNGVCREDSPHAVAKRIKVSQGLGGQGCLTKPLTKGTGLPPRGNRGDMREKSVNDESSRFNNTKDKKAEKRVYIGREVGTTPDGELGKGRAAATLTFAPD